MSNLFAILMLALAPDFPEARDFPEGPPDAPESGILDFHTSESTMLVQLTRKARVKYGSGRVVTLYACQALNVNKDGTVLVKTYGDERLLNVKLAGVQLQPIEPYAPEQTYGWKGGPLIDRADRDRVVTLAEMERHSLLVDTHRRDLWVEFEGEFPTPPLKPNYQGYLYNIQGTRNVGRDLIETGYAHVAPGARSAKYLQGKQDRAAKERKGLWDEGRWRDQQAKGFAYLKKPPATTSGSRPKSLFPPASKGRPR